MKALPSKAAALVLFGSALMLPAPGDAASNVAGYLDTKTGTFTAVPSQAELAAAAAATLTRTGKLTVVVNVQLDPSIPPGQQVNCSVTISSSDFPGISNSASAQSGVVRTGATGKCTTVIPYIWIVAKAATVMNVNVNVNTGGSFGAVSHSASTSFPAFPVPNGNKSLTVAIAL
jgi:hypothetical protein